ncbi:hypothetical protein [Microbacterium sp. NPDC079995]|uniref:hypothetical protein n=1 Tax=unclassified Microbacterium TaxID=2609290 RepID=UPI00344D89A8
MLDGVVAIAGVVVNAAVIEILSSGKTQTVHFTVRRVKGGAAGLETRRSRRGLAIITRQGVRHGYVGLNGVTVFSSSHGNTDAELSAHNPEERGCHRPRRRRRR